MTVALCVCIPARNEAAHIATLFDALAAQDVAAPFAVALCVNNSDDGTTQIASDAAERVGSIFALHLCECVFAPERAHAGSARRAAMELGVAALGAAGGLLISTDADCNPPRDWISANLAAAAPDRIIGGRIELDEAEAAQAPELFALRQRFDAYWRQVRKIEDSIDPSPSDPAPRHGDHTGASLALSVDLYQRAGGVPLLPVGEDRALVDAAIAAGGTLIHPQSVWTRASARIVGRAAGGMADDLQRWLDVHTRGETPSVPHFDHWDARARWRRDQRQKHGLKGVADAERQLPPMPCDMALPAASGR
ncbi:glycosyltransferase [Sphingomonas nostoxanthinifaciens]|uniref:glycosyltransferase n=1 Tax=Sphingomonas nostoxanthinifaciens TaxID=2872652 RepID=UPI001CC204CF|nr:glycosyltransferase [Sphingomonas nostoxanthinifaciens]UAK25707.1 glycosyltransferase [Sphingomonas nostoxanthinifaciens]